MTERFHFDALVALCQQTDEDMRERVTRTVNVALTVRNWLFGWYIVEYEQLGEDRAEYGSKLIARLSSQLRIRGTSPTNLKKFRQFYREYPIRQPTAVESESALTLTNNWRSVSEELFGRFSLSWTHYATLLTIQDPNERRFYELEALDGGWGKRELARQISSSLYERLALSRDKGEIRRLSQEGLVILRRKEFKFAVNPMFDGRD